MIDRLSAARDEPDAGVRSQLRPPKRLHDAKHTAATKLCCKMLNASFDF